MWWHTHEIPTLKRLRQEFLRFMLAWAKSKTLSHNSRAEKVANWWSTYSLTPSNAKPKPNHTVRP